MCGSKSSSPAQKPTPKPTTNLKPVEATEGTTRNDNMRRFHRAHAPRPGATMLTGE